jgi:type II secretory pathway component PulC
VNDPTKPLYDLSQPSFNGVKQQTKAAPLTLSSILISQDRKLVIINGQVLQEMQVVKGHGARVQKIEADAVTLQQNGKTWRVLLNNTVVRKQ